MIDDINETLLQWTGATELAKTNLNKHSKYFCRKLTDIQPAAENAAIVIIQ